jgi:hypothetical protein
MFSSAINCPLTDQAGPCRILRLVLLSAADNAARPELNSEVDAHWRKVKGIKSYLTLSGGSRSRGQTVHHVLDTTDFTLPRGHPPRIRQGDFVVSPKDYNLIECIKSKDDAPACHDKSGSRASLGTAAVVQYSEIKTSEITKLNHKSDKD